MVEKIIILYEHFFQISSGHRNFEFTPTERQNKTINNFCNKLPINYGDNWLFDYFCFQFGRYYSMNTRFGKGKIMLNWVIGKKALDHYKQASEEEKHFGEMFRLNFHIQNPLKKTEKIELNHLDIERKRWYNTDLGLLHCKNLELYEERNKLCMICKNKNYCKDE